MQSPLLYLALCSMRNNLRVRLRRLRQPRYLIGLLVGIGYFYVFLFRPRPGAGGRGGPMSIASMAIGGRTIVQLAAGALLFLMMALAWIWPWSKPALAFSRADVQFLFTAPISRRRLVRYKVLRTQVGALFGSAIMTLIFRPSSFSTGWTFFLGLALVMAIVNLHTTGVSLSRATLAVPGAWRSLQRWAPPAIVAAAFAVIVGTLALHWADLTAAGARGGDVVAEIERLGTTGAAGVVLWPFRAIAGLPLAESPTAFLAALPFALLVLMLNYVWVLRTDVAFEEASAELSEKLARIKREGIVAPRRPRSTARTPFALGLDGPAETAILWKNLILMGRFLSWTLLLRVAPVLVMLTFIIAGAGRRGETVNMLAFFCVFIAGMTVLLGPQMTRSDLRNDLANLAVLKTWPVRGAALVRGEILAPAVVLSVAASLALIAAAVLSTHAAFTRPIVDRWAYLLAALLLAPGVILAQLLVQNGLAVTFPSWVGVGPQRGGVDVMGQRLLMMIANLLALAVVVLPAALVAVVSAAAGYALLGTIPIVLPAMLAAATLQVEAFVGSEAIGALLDRTDVSAIDPLDA